MYVYTDELMGSFNLFDTHMQQQVFQPAGAVSPA